MYALAAYVFIRLFLWSDLCALSKKLLKASYRVCYENYLFLNKVHKNCKFYTLLLITSRELD